MNDSYDSNGAQEIVNEDKDPIGWLLDGKIDFEDGYDEIHQDKVNELK